MGLSNSGEKNEEFALPANEVVGTTGAPSSTVCVTPSNAGRMFDLRFILVVDVVFKVFQVTQLCAWL